MKEKTTATAADNTNSILTLLLLFFVYPIGVVVMWLWTSWAKWVKILVTLPVILIILFGVLFGIGASLNVGEQVKKAECVKQCENSALKETCQSQCMGSLNAPPSYEGTPLE
jgi:uncharacterized protein (DUF983 family)